MRKYVLFSRVGLVVLTFISVSCGGDESVVNPPSPGSIQVSVATSGDNPDADGYMVSIDGGAGQAIAANGSATISDQTVGNHTVELTEVAANCTVQGGNPRTVAVSAGSSTPVAVAVACTALVGDLRVTTSTTGEDLDPDAYMLSLDGGTPEPMAVNAERTFASLSAGVHEVELSGISENCSVAGASSQTVSVQAGGTEAVTFDVTCGMAVGSIRVTASTTGEGLGGGYLVSLDGGPAQDLDANDSGISASGFALFSDLSLGNHTVTLTGLQHNCAVDGENPRELTVSFGQTLETIFNVICTVEEMTPGESMLGSTDSEHPGRFFKFYVPEGGDFSVSLEVLSGPGLPRLILEDEAGHSVEAIDGTSAWQAGTGLYCAGNPATASFVDMPGGWYFGTIVGVQDCDDVTGMTTLAPVDSYSLSVEPGVSANVVVELHWPPDTSDLDAYMTGPIGFTGDRFIAYWNDRGSLDAMPYAWYAQDAPFNGPPPEYIQLSRQMDGIYRFYAISGPNTPEGLPILIRVVIDGTVVQEFSWSATAVSYNGSTYEGEMVWEVFELSGTTITVIDTHSHCAEYAVDTFLSCFE
jgi:hypothetical protein